MKLLKKDISDLLESKVKDIDTDADITKFEKELLDKYFSDKPIDFSKSDFEDYPHIPTPINLESKVCVEDDLATAIALYEAFPDLTLIEASSHEFWTTLSHTVLLDYMRKRWPYEKKGKVKVYNHINNHWFYASKLRKNALAHLWWCVAVSIDKDANAEHKYDLTKIFFKNMSFRVVFWGSSNFFRYQEATKGILRFLKDNEADMFKDKFENRGKYISMYFNQLGGVKQLACMDEQFFYDEMKKIKADILDAPDRIKKIGFQDDVETKEDLETLA